MNPLLQALAISVLGLGLTFAALGLFALIILLLQRLFPEMPSRQIPPAAQAPAHDSAAEEVVAAIAVALTYLRSREFRPGALGGALEAGRGPWWVGGISTRPTKRRGKR